MHLKERLFVMILMFLGSVTLVLFGFQLALQSAKKLISPLHKTFVEQNGSTLAGMFVRGVFLNIIGLSTKENFEDTLSLWQSGLKARRESVLRFCLASLGYWGALFLAALYLGFSGYFILGFAFFGFISIVQKRTSPALWSMLLGLGIYLVGAEVALRQSSILVNLLGTSEAAFFLADGRFPAVFSLMLLSLILSLLLRLEMWSLIVSLGLLVTNIISFNGALGIVTGELLAVSILWIWKTRTLAAPQKGAVLKLAIASLIGTFLGFWIAGETKTYFDIGFGADFAAYQGRIWSFVSLTGLIVLVHMAVLMPVGHFVAKEPLRAGPDQR